MRFGREIQTSDSPTVNTTSSSGSHLNGKFDGHADLPGVSAQYRF